MVGGVAIAVGGIAAAAKLAPETMGSSAMIAYESIMFGSALFAIGLTRVTGEYQGSVLDDLESLLGSPFGDAMTELNKRRSTNGFKN